MLVAYVATIGHRIETLCKAEALFSELKAFVASISNTASVSVSLASIISRFVTLVTHAITLLITSPTPISRTSPLSLSSGTNQFAKTASIVAGSTSSVQSILASMATASQIFALDVLNDLLASILLKPFASTPEGPPEPLS